MREIHIIYGTDNNYWFPTAVSAASAAHFALEPDRIVFHLFDAGVTDENYEKYREIVMRASDKVSFKRHKLGADMFSGFGEWKGSVVTYSRMFMAELLPDVDWAIYIDGDTLWLGDPAELWNLRDDKKLVLASIDPPTTMLTPNKEFVWYRERGLEIDSSGYLCMGLMVANLKLMREEHIPEKCRDFMAKFPCPRVVDQTVLNYVCQGRTSPLPANWGVFSVWHGTVDLSQPSIIHYCQDLPYCRTKINRLMSDVVLIWFEFCKRVLGRNEYLRVPPLSRTWRRLVFVALKRLQGLVKLNPYVHSRLRNTHGIPSKQYEAILAKMVKR